MNRFLADILQDALEEKRKRDELLAVIMQDFVHDESSIVRRGVVHEAVAKRLNKSVSNHLVLQIQDAIYSLPGVHGFKRNGLPHYRSLRSRTVTEAPTLSQERSPIP